MFQMTKLVYASSTEDGMFEELVVLEKWQIIDDSCENEDGVKICFYLVGGEETVMYYIDVTEV